MSRDVHAGEGPHPTHAERAAWIGGVGALWAVGYFGLGRASGDGLARSLATPIDALIPFLPWTVWVYLLGLVVIASPAVAPCTRGALRRTVASYGLVLMISFACFWLYPVTSIDLRPASGAMGLKGATAWALRQLYRIDPTVNLFPSLHVSLCAVAVISWWRVSRALGVCLAAVGVLVCLSVCTVKQHFAVDVLGGVGLGVAAAAALRSVSGQMYADRSPSIVSSDPQSQA